MWHQLLAAASSVNWQAAAVIVAAGGGIAKYLGRKLDQVGAHLEDQDDALAALAQRVARLEGYERLNRQEALDRLTRRRGRDER